SRCSLVGGGEAEGCCCACRRELLPTINSKAITEEWILFMMCFVAVTGGACARMGCDDRAGLAVAGRGVAAIVWNSLGAPAACGGQGHRQLASGKPRGRMAEKTDCGDFAWAEWAGSLVQNPVGTAPNGSPLAS